MCGCVLHSWSRTPSCVAMSSVDAEYNSIALAVMEGRRIQQFLEERYVSAEEVTPVLQVYSDSKGARESCVKGSSSRMRQIEIEKLFACEFVHQGLVILEAIGTQENPVEVLTKPVPQAALRKLVRADDAGRRGSKTP